MGKWLEKFQETPLSSTDNTDVVGTASALSVPTLGISSKSDDLNTFFNERAAIIEFDGGLSRRLAEDMAYLYALQKFVMCNYANIYKDFELILKNVK